MSITITDGAGRVLVVDAIEAFDVMVRGMTTAEHYHLAETYNAAMARGIALVERACSTPVIDFSEEYLPTFSEFRIERRLEPEPHTGPLNRRGRRRRCVK